MRLTGFIVIIFVAILFMIPVKKGNTSFVIEAQEERPYQEVMSEPDTFNIIYSARNPKEDPIADILWMKKAARIAERAGIPYFNVLKQEITTHYVDRYDQELSVVSGVIQLDRDPMHAQYDAREILSLVLTDYP